MFVRSLTHLALAAVLVAATGCSKEWETFRHNGFRTAHQPNATDLSDPSKVPNLGIEWQWQMPAVTIVTSLNGRTANARSFRASPVIDQNRVYIGGADGIFRAFNADTGALLWQFPTPAQISSATQPPLLSKFACNPSSRGIASSAATVDISGVRAVIFGAPDSTTTYGSGRLFALNAATGAEIWRSDVVATVSGTTSGSFSQLHEQIGYSAPLIFNSRVYIGIGNHCDNPIQQGKVRAVFLSSGNLDTGFLFVGAQGAGGASTPGGGVWTHVATDLNSLYTTTGNIKSGNASEPPVNNALAMVRINRTSGAVQGKIQPVPFDMDGDPDWSAGPAVMISSSCGLQVVSTMKDGWTYAAKAVGNAFPLTWQFPSTGYPFSPGDGTGALHGDIRFLRPGAAWGSVFVTMAGGRSTTNASTRGQNFGRLHAFNVCAAASERVRWIKDIPGTPAFGSYRLGPPTITRGIVYVGTTNGNLVVIADPTKAPAAGFRCEHPDIATSACVSSGFNLVPDPAVLANVQLQGRILTEPVLSKGRVFVATDSGWLYMVKVQP